MTRSRIIVLLSCVLLALGAVVFTMGGEIKGLFETADSQLDYVTFEEPSSLKGLTSPTRPTSPRRGQSPSGYLSNAYLGGSGSLDHMAELIDEGISLDGKSFQTGEAMVRAAAHVEAGRVTQAVAVIDDQMVLLGVASERWRDSELGEDVELLGRYKDVLGAHSRGALSRDARGFMSKALAYNGYRLTR